MHCKIYADLKLNSIENQSFALHIILYILLEKGREVVYSG
jgi:BarA-like signal transduction histidine kinase